MKTARIGTSAFGRKFDRTDLAMNGTRPPEYTAHTDKDILICAILMVHITS